MSNEKHIQYYIELLTKSVNEAIISNLSLQASARVREDYVNEMKSEFDKVNLSRGADIQSLKELVDRLTFENTSLKQKNEEMSVTLSSVYNQVGTLTSEVDILTRIKNEYESAKPQLLHAENLRKELILFKNENRDLRSQLVQKTVQDPIQPPATKAKVKTPTPKDGGQF